MWNPFKTLFNSTPKKEETCRVTADELALKEARRLLNMHIDQLAESFAKEHRPEFEAGDRVQVNAFGINKPKSIHWEGGARMLIECLNAPLGEPIQAKITGYKVHSEMAREVIEWFFGERWDEIVKWVLEGKTEDLIQAFDRKLDRVAKDRSYLTPHKCLYMEYHFKTGSKEKPEFEPLWGLSANAFYPIDSKEAKVTRNLHKQYRKLDAAREEIKKVEEEIKRLNGPL